MIIGLSVNVFLGNVLGANGLGVINLSQRVVNILIVLGLFGMRQVIVKEVAISHNKKELARIGSVMYTSYLLNGGIILVLSVAMILLAPWLSTQIFNEPSLTFPLMIALLVATPQVFSRIFSSALIGYRKIWQSNLVDQTLSLFVTGSVLIIYWLFEIEITINKVAIAYAIGRLIVTLSIGIYWKKLFKYKGKKEWRGKELLKTAHSLFGVELAVILSSNASVLLIGAFLDSKEVGLYSVANRLALLTSFFLQVSTSVIAPKVAALYEQNRKQEVGVMVRKITGGLSLLGLITFALFFLLGEKILSLWGDEFKHAYWLLIILSFGQFFNLATGAVGVILNMTGYERIHRNISLIITFSTILLSFLVINVFGSIGIAVVIGLGITIENIVKVWYVKRKVGISTLPNFPRISFK